MQNFLEVGKRLATVRRHFEIKQVDFASYLGVGLRGYQLWERGKPNFNSYSMQKLYEKGVDLNWLVSGHGPMLRDGTAEPVIEVEQPKPDSWLSDTVTYLTNRCMKLESDLAECRAKYEAISGNSAAG